VIGEPTCYATAVSTVILRTARQTLRLLEPDDAEMMFALNGDPEVMRFLPDGPYASVHAARLFLEQYQDVYRKDGFARWAAVEDATGAAMGWCGLRRLPDGDVDVAYRYLRPAWGRGLATEAARASLQYGFEVLALPRIIARAAPGNAASIRVLQKIGLRYEKRENTDGHEWTVWASSREQWEDAQRRPV
jgi:RimJ/RimL family protein N-acetyltransferase